MNDLVQNILLSIVLISVLSCTPLSLQHNKGYELISVVNTPPDKQDDPLSASIRPYRDSLLEQMNEVIAFADTNFVVERPSGNLNDWVADAVLVNQTKNVRMTLPAMCLLNFGGLRSPINHGEVTLGDIYKVSPFDNKVVWATMPLSVLPEIASYLSKTGGEPIAGATFKDGVLTLNSPNDQQSEFVIITSDFLVNGGDKMYFFQKATEITHTDKLLRDCLIEEAKAQRTLIRINN